MAPQEDIFHNMKERDLWKKYCGFLDLSTEEFMVIQNQLLLEQIALVSGSPLAKKIMGDSRPGSMEEFRHIVPITTYQDYLPYLEEKREDVLSENPLCWVNTSGKEGDFKWVPYTSKGYQKLIDSLVSALILSSAKKEGQVNIKKGARIMFHLPSKPYLSGHFAFGLNQRIACHAFPPIEIFDRLNFEEKLARELELVRKEGVDFIFSLPGNLVEMGAKFTKQLNTDRSGSPPFFSWWRLKLMLIRLITRIRDKPIVPRYLYRPRGIICTGVESSFHRQEIECFWGKKPYDIYLAAETGCLALPGWTGDELNFTPFNGFLEFIPEEEWDGVGKLKSPCPDTRLINQLEVGQRYEIIVTNFYGMPFLRYRLGDIIKVVAPENGKADVGPPKILYESRITDIIDNYSYIEINERTIWQALINSGLKYEDWFLAEEESEGEHALHLYVELKNSLGAEIDKLLLESTVPIEVNARSMVNIPDIPLKVTLLPGGTFQNYKTEKGSFGFDLASLKMAHINPGSKFIAQILSQQQAD